MAIRMKGRPGYPTAPAALIVCSLLFAVVGALPAPAAGQAPANPAAARTIALQLKNIDIFDALKMLSERGDLDIAIGPGVQGRVTLFLEETDIFDALDLVVETAGLAYVRSGNLIKVMTPKQYQDTYGESFKSRQVVETIHVRHIEVGRVYEAVNQLKTQTGKLIVDEGSNSLVLVDVPKAIRKMMSVIAELDLPVTTQAFELRHTTPALISESLVAHLVPSVRVSADPTSNRILLTDKPENLAGVGELIALYDVASTIETRVIYLSYANPDEVATKLASDLTVGVGALRPIANSQSLILTDLPQRVAVLSQLIAAIDRPTREVLIEAKILRVSLSDNFRMGVNWTYVEQRLNDFELTNTFNVLAPGESGVRIVSGNLTDDNYTLLIEALQVVGETNLLASPRIAGLNGKESKILVGANVPYTTTDTREENGIIRTFEKVTIVDVGTKLYVTPWIHEDGFVTMDIRPEVSAVIGASDGIPIVETSMTETSVMVKDGVTIVLSGLIEDKEEKIVSQVPLLGSIPLLGNLFKSTDRKLSKSELVVLLTPRIFTGDVISDGIERYQGGLEDVKTRIRQAP